jgi:hypothetical protein
VEQDGNIMPNVEFLQAGFTVVCCYTATKERKEIISWGDGAKSSLSLLLLCSPTPSTCQTPEVFNEAVSR